jgi:hypothetical protein
MDRTELIYFVVLTFIILFAPFFPTGVLLLLDHIVFRLAAVILLLYLISVGPTAGIFGLMVIAVLYLERNRRKVAAAVKKLDRMDVYRPAQATVKEEGIPQKTVPVNPFTSPNNEESSYVPEDADCMDTNFEPVAPTINQKAVLSTIYPLSTHAPESGTAATELYEKLGFGHVEGVKTMGDS